MISAITICGINNPITNVKTLPRIPPVNKSEASAILENMSFFTIIYCINNFRRNKHFLF